jgi:hypothetical protein
LVIVVLASFPCAVDLTAQSQQQKPSDAETADASVVIAPAVADAEASIVKSEWKTAQTKLDTWIAAHPSDARALSTPVTWPMRRGDWTMRQTCIGELLKLI